MTAAPITGCLCTWEKNSYHDGHNESDFLVMRWSGSALEGVLHDTTRAADCGRAPIVWATDAEILAAREFWVRGEASRLCALDAIQVATPRATPKGEHVVFKAACIIKPRGKQPVTIMAGTPGVVTFYRRTGRGTRCGVRLADGREVWTSIDRLSLHREPLSMDRSTAYAEAVSWVGDWACRGAWATRNHAKERLTVLRATLTRT